MTTLSDLCRQRLQADPGAPAIEFEHTWYRWGEMRQLAEELEAALNILAPDRGGRVALVARNRPSAIAAFIGLLACGYNIRMVYPFQSPESLARELASIEPVAVVADREDLRESVIRHLLERGSATISLDAMNVSASEAPEPASTSGTRTSNPIVEILTSGTTGPPRTFAISYEDIGKHIVANSALPGQLRGAEEDLPPSLLMFPISNISGLYSTLPPLLAGQRAVLLERFTVEGWHDHLLRFKPQMSGLPPAGVQMILDANIPRDDLSCLTALGTGAASLDLNVHRAFEERYGVPILLSYGATEFGGPVTRMTPELLEEWRDRKFGSVGRALPGVRLRVIEPETGEELPPGSEGLLEVISPRIGPDWIRTTDIVALDEDGFLFHRGRADGAIMRGGFKLLPAAIERGLLTHPAVSQACVIAVADKRLGQVPGAALELKSGEPAPTIEAVENHLRTQVPATHVPVFWKVVETLPRTPSMKVDLLAVQRLFEQPND